MRQQFPFLTLAALLPFAGCACAQTLTMQPSLAAPAPATPTQLADLAIIRERVTAGVQRDAVLAPEAIAKLVGDLTAQGTWPEMNYRDQANGSWSPSDHLVRVGQMALAYAMPKLAGGAANPNFHSAPLLEATMRAYDGWFSVLPPGTPPAKANPGNVFKDDLTTPTSLNWWHNEIGVPLKMSAVLLLLPTEISGERKNKGLQILARAWSPNGDRRISTAANLSWRARIMTARAVLSDDAALLSGVIDTLSNAFHVGMDEGPQPDYSFHQHGAQFYLLAYGLGFSSDMTELSGLYQGTKFTFRPQLLELLTHMTLDGYQWVMRGPVQDYSASGREVAIPTKKRGPEIVTVIDRLLALNAPRQDELKAFRARLTGEKDAPPLLGNRAFFRSGVMSHQRAGYGVSVRVTPATLRGGEVINSQGQQSRYTGDGVTYLMRGGDEYLNLFPTLNFRLLPGTTGALSPAKPKMTGPYVEGVGRFGGGVSDGTYGATGYDYARDGVSARKGWFFFDDEYVCLGSGISAEAGLSDPIVSAVEERRAIGEIERAPDGKWLVQDGAGTVFLDQSAKIEAHVGAQTGSWRDVNSDSRDTKPITENVFSLYLDHGAHPQNASYAYIVVPNTSAQALSAYAAAPPVEVLSNTREVQAVRHAKLGITQAVFYGPATLAVKSGVTLSVSRPCLLLWNERAGQLTVADPNDPALPDSTNPDKPVVVPTTPIAPVIVSLSPRPGASQKLTFGLPNGMFAGQSVTQKIRP